jgi:hypothetical protein
MTDLMENLAVDSAATEAGAGSDHASLRRDGVIGA